ncbi:MAG TPA: cobalamin-binding protein [Mariniphaga anaerophila]|uniref:Cobalamin-binding protein n=1 Tax=Mariniphaga anaerophila TaxID=1484053 RepID=A0A831LMH6_9BACT|nr:cobalamin-binding protein [Mariniphaga anaerophila]
MEKLAFYSNQLERAFLTLDKEEAEKILTEALRSGSPVEIAGELVSVTLHRIGEAWEEGKLALSQVYMSGMICEELIDKILPPQSPDRKSQPKMAIAVFEDYHMLGKRIIFSTLRSSGYDLLDLGGGLHTDKLIEIVHKEKIKILLLSVLMLPSALHVKELKQKLNGTDVKIVVGGAPFRFDENLWKEVGADAFGKDPAQAIQIVSQIMEELK